MKYALSANSLYCKNMNTLEILIPTYGRPESAAQAIESCFINLDNRVSVRCNSNGFEPSLERFRNYHSRLIYTSFNSNKGSHANFLYLLQHTKAKFCMLLSDEDRIDSNGLKEILDYLDSCPDFVSVVSCSVYDMQESRYSFMHDIRLTLVDHDLNSLLALKLIPTYMSGLIFSVNSLCAIDLVSLLHPSTGNAYGHLDISKHLLVHGRLRLYSSKFVLKGIDVYEGGDGYSHRKSALSKQGENFDLNPLIYGPKARARQFYYSDNILCSLRPYMDFISYKMAKFQNFSFFYYMTIMSDVITIIDSKTTIKNEVIIALREAQNLNEYRFSSWLAYLFCPLLIIPKPVKFFLTKIFDKLYNLYRRLRILTIVRNGVC